jgi:hypothetical protein
MTKTMVKRHLYKIVLFFFVLNLNSCKKSEVQSVLSKPVIYVDVQKSAIQVGGVKVNTGPLKDYEQDSDVNFKLTVTSGTALVNFGLTTTSNANSAMSKIIATDPADAIDAKGVFTKQLNSVVVYYSFHIDPLNAPLTPITLNFTFQNETGYVGFIAFPLTVIKKGSSSGVLLNTRVLARGLGIQDNMNRWSGIRSESGTATIDRSGSFYSLEKLVTYRMVEDCILDAASIDLVGYKTKAAGTAPILVTNSYYLVSPSDTVVLTSTYAGASTAPDFKDVQLRNTIRQMAKNVAASGKSLRKVLFRRLDNIAGPNQVTPAYFNQLTHDNEYDTLLAGIASGGVTTIGPMGQDQVYGFVMDDGRRGLLWTWPPTITDANGVTTTYSAPIGSLNQVLFFTIKYQNKK